MEITITLTETDEETGNDQPSELQRFWNKLTSDEKRLKHFQERIREAIEIEMMQAGVGWGEGFEVIGFKIKYKDNLKVLDQ